MRHLLTFLLLICVAGIAAADVPLQDLEVTLEVLEDDGSDLSESIARLPSDVSAEFPAPADSDDGFVDDADTAANDELEELGTEEVIVDDFASDAEFSDDIPLGTGDDLDEEEEVELDTYDDEEMGSSL